MSSNIDKINRLQDLVLDSLIKNSFRGTVVLATGHGKNAVALKAMNYIHSNLIHNPRVLILAETTFREANIREDFIKLHKLYPELSYTNFQFLCYQSAYKSDLEVDIVICDEIHFTMTPIYSEVFKNIKSKYWIGLTATPELGIEYEETIKKDYYEQFCPIIFKYRLKDAVNNSTATNIQYHIIEKQLDSVNKNIEAGNKTNRFYTTEASMYSYINKNFSKALFMENSDLISMWAAKRARFLYTLPSRMVEGKNLIDKLISEGKRFIVFHNDLPSLEELLPNKVISTKNSKHNERLYDSFQSKEINEIGSFRILAQGANLVDLDAIIILSYYSSEDKLEQLVGRLRNNGKLNNVYIVVYTDTQEKKWFDKATSNLKLN